MLATIAELLDVANHLYLSAHVKKGTVLPKLIEIRRPGWEPPKPPPMEEAVGFFGVMGDGTAGNVIVENPEHEA